MSELRDDRRDRLRASKPAAQAAKDAFVSRYASGREDRAVGLGVGPNGDEWTLRVFVQSYAAAAALPDHFDQFDVEVQVTGPARAF